MFSWPKNKSREDLDLLAKPANKNMHESPNKPDDIGPTKEELEALRHENKELKGMIQQLNGAIGQQGGMLQGLFKSMQQQQSQAPARDPFEMPNIPDDKWEELSMKDVMSLMTQMVKNGIEANNNLVMEEIKKLQQHTNTQYGSSEKNRMVQSFPDFMEWEQEMVQYMRKLGQGAQFTPEEIYKAVRLQNSEKAKELDKKYGMSGIGNSNPFRWGSFPAQDNDEPVFEIKPFDPEKGTDARDQVHEDIESYLKFRNAGSISDVLEKDETEFF